MCMLVFRPGYRSLHVLNLNDADFKKNLSLISEPSYVITLGGNDAKRNAAI